MKTIILLITALLTAVPGFAYDKDEQAVKEAVENLLQGPSVDAVTRTALPGLYEVVVADKTIYYMPSSGQFIVGLLFSKDGENLSAKTLERHTGERLQQIKSLDFQKDKAIKVGTGPVSVIEVSDPDCPFCRKMEVYWRDRQKDVTRYVFLMPVTALHPDSEKKARYILAAHDKVEAFHLVLSGKLDADQATLNKSLDDKGLLKIHKEITAKAGVKATPTYLINGIVVYGADVERIDDLIRQGMAAGLNKTDI